MRPTCAILISGPPPKCCGQTCSRGHPCRDITACNRTEPAFVQPVMNSSRPPRPKNGDAFGTDNLVTGSQRRVVYSCTAFSLLPSTVHRPGTSSPAGGRQITRANGRPPAETTDALRRPRLLIPPHPTPKPNLILRLAPDRRQSSFAGQPSPHADRRREDEVLRGAPTRFLQDSNAPTLHQRRVRIARSPKTRSRCAGLPRTRNEKPQTQKVPPTSVPIILLA